MALPNPLPGPLAVTCAVTGVSVARQYERALAESRIRYAGIAPSSVLLFNFFQPHIMVPPGVPILILAATDETVTSILALDGCPVFWRTRALAPLGAAGGGWDNGRQGDLVRDLTEAVEYGEATLGMEPPGHVWVTGPPTEVRGLAPWLAAQVGLPTTFLEARTLPAPRPPGPARRGLAPLGRRPRRRHPPIAIPRPPSVVDEGTTSPLLSALASGAPGGPRAVRPASAPRRNDSDGVGAPLSLLETPESRLGSLPNRLAGNGRGAGSTPDTGPPPIRAVAQSKRHLVRDRVRCRVVAPRAPTSRGLKAVTQCSEKREEENLQPFVPRAFRR